MSKEERNNLNEMTERQFLYYNWGSPTFKAFFKTQPLDQIRYAMNWFHNPSHLFRYSLDITSERR